MRARLFIAAALAGAAVVAHAELAEIRWDGPSAGRSFDVQPAKFAEWCGRLPAGQSVAWRFEAAAPLDFNIHYHEGKAVHFPAKRDGAAKAEGTLRVASEQDFCWMWTNKSAQAVTVRAHLSLATVPAEFTDGKVVEVDLRAGTVVLDHAEIRHLGMDAMAMEFHVDDLALLGRLRKGDTVQFKATYRDRRYVIVELRRRSSK